MSIRVCSILDIDCDSDREHAAEEVVMYSESDVEALLSDERQV